MPGYRASVSYRTHCFRKKKMILLDFVIQLVINLSNKYDLFSGFLLYYSRRVKYFLKFDKAKLLRYILLHSTEYIQSNVYLLSMEVMEIVSVERRKKMVCHNNPIYAMPVVYREYILFDK